MPLEFVERRLNLPAFMIEGGASPALPFFVAAAMGLSGVTVFVLTVDVEHA